MAKGQETEVTGVIDYMPDKKLVKIQFYDPDVGYENLWAAHESKDRYRIESIPFFIYGLSSHDIVTASPDSKRKLQFGNIVKRSGNRTLRARSEKFIKNAAYRKKVTADLERLGCDVEELRSRLLAINIPKNVNLQAVTDYLTNDAKVSWECGNPENQNQPR
jgi:hypothetical protein